MKSRLSEFIAQLTLHDYLLFTGAVVLFILFLVLAILMRRRKPVALLCTVLGVSALTLLPTVGYVELNDYLYTNDINVTEVKALEFTDALMVRGTLTNRSKRDFDYCTVTAGVYKVAHNPVLDLLFPLNPFRRGSVTETEIAKGERTEFKIFVEPFRYTKDYNVTIGAICR